MTKLSECAIGDKLRVTDNSFDCMVKNDIKIVNIYNDCLFIYCKDGMHILDGQTRHCFSGVKGDDTLIGLEKVRSNDDATQTNEDA